MKQIIMIAVHCFMVIMATQAQTQAIISKEPMITEVPNQYLIVLAERCIMKNNTAHIDILIVNTSSDTNANRNTFINPLPWGNAWIQFTPSIEIRDNQGVIYNNENLNPRNYKIYISPYYRDPKEKIISLFVTPVEIPMGYTQRIQITVVGGFDKSATMIERLKVNFFWNKFSPNLYEAPGTVELRNVPIYRE